MAEIKSILRDERIEAFNVLLTISIKEYLSFARFVVDDNEFQRKRVIKSKIKEILKEDLLRNCLIPSIVLAVTNEDIKSIKDENDSNSAQTIIDKAIEEKSILIIDGLQRTYVMLNLEDELKRNPHRAIELEKLYNHKIRAEVYLGLNRIGLLYRMITLNTGQTTMSTRHLMEILYLDYSRIGIDGIRLIKDKDDSPIAENSIEYNFKTVLDGFNSYIEKDEGIVERVEILDNIRSLDLIKFEDLDKDLFKEFLLTFKLLLDTLEKKSFSWKYDRNNVSDQALKLNSNPFGKSITDIFKKSQVMTGFGAAIGYLKEVKEIDFAAVAAEIPNLYFENDDPNIAIQNLLKQLDIIKEKSKKIGNDQRFYFKFFFRSLFNPESDQHLNIGKAADEAFKRTREEKFN